MSAKRNNITPVCHTSHHGRYPQSGVVGNTIICTQVGRGNPPQLIEVTPDKRVVWMLRDWVNFGGSTAIQILDDPGIPENPGESEH